MDLKQYFPFELDGFQKEAIAALEAGKSVVVCAPTGSGKTLVGEYAIHRALSQRKRVFYTTPLKALSNQKLRDFRDQFGGDYVGLLTGDISINREAPILVMTTEIFRNMLYGTPIGEVGTSLEGVETVVLDECHYMNDAQRGTVWEESIIYCPPSIQLVALSATIANSQELTDWIAHVHGPTELIYSDFRPVPLQFYFCHPKGLFPLLNPSGKAINERLKPKPGSSGVRRSKKDTPSAITLLTHLKERDMLPAIYFIFSRRGCDKAVQDVGPLSLVSPEEAARLKTQIDDFLVRNPEAGRVGQVEPLYRGIAAHHAGILPTWKSLVEELFQQGLIKVVFATETLAAGINMPARTTVVSSLSKRTDTGHRLLNPSEFLQMAGRAGRRGMDDQGYVVTVQTVFEGAPEAAYLATSKPDPLVSQFTPSYGMVLNLLQTHTLEEVRELVERSFGRYLIHFSLKPQQQAIDDLQREVDQLQTQLADVDWAQVARYEKLRERLREEKRLLKLLKQQADDLRSLDLAMALQFAVTGTLLTLKGKHLQFPAPIPAVLAFKVRTSGQLPYFVCLGGDNHWYVATVHDVIGLHGELPRIAAIDRCSEVPPELPLKPGQVRGGTEETIAISRQVVQASARLGADTLLLDEAPEFRDQIHRVEQVEAELNAHPVHGWRNLPSLLKRRRRLDSLQEELRDRQVKLDQLSQQHWQEFLRLIQVLQHFGCLEGLKPTPLGEATASIRGDNELWLCLALLSGELDDLEPHQFAAACAALVTEVNRHDSWAQFDLSMEVEQSLANLWDLRRQVIQAQDRHRVTVPVLPYKWQDIAMAAIVEHWSMEQPDGSYIAWSELCERTSLDEGDVVRILRRTLDFLSQIPHVPHIHEDIRRLAYQTMRQVDRFPVSEVLD